VGGRRINMLLVCEVEKGDSEVQVENLEIGEAAN
jgi:hypothetical protein